jgi:IS30 family transposase
MVPLSARLAEADDRTVPGHWEGDLVMGSRPSAIATLVERTSRYTRLVALPEGIKAEQVRPYLTGSILAVPVRLRRSLTWDRGREMVEHRIFSAATGMPVYFCKPRSPWQRGTNEASTGCCASIWPRTPICASSRKQTWMPSPPSSTTVLGRSTATAARRRSTLRS